MNQQLLSLVCNAIIIYCELVCSILIFIFYLEVSMKKQKVGFTETALRDASQSLIATRLSYDKMEPILETMDKAGFYSCEVWGGATFDVCLRFLNEDPWERLRKIRAHCRCCCAARIFWATSIIRMTS